jgi:predicted ATPase/transcriptional regulator with XRE-family HTH domain
MADNPGAELAEYVRMRRLRAGLTQEMLAERAGLSSDSVGALERGLRRRLYPHTARAIAEALDLSEAERVELAELAQGGRARQDQQAEHPDAVALTLVPPSAPAGTESPDVAPAGTAAHPSRLSAPAVAAPDTTRPLHNLPASLTRLIGRERELAQIQDRLAHTRLLTLTGAGGIGKTRLAMESARALRPQYPDGVWLVELAPITDPSLVLGAVATVLGVRETPGQPLLTALTDTLRARRLLLVLDNCEQVLDAAPNIAALLGACPDLTVLATSRAPLRLSGEHELLVPPLPVPEGSGIRDPESGGGDLWGGSRIPDPGSLAGYAAVDLFVERAIAVKADFALTPENAPAVAAICARLDGLPLALELAAARVKLLPPQALLTRLDSALGGLRFLTGGAHDLPARQRTLRATIAWSYDLLASEEQALFRRLGVFVGGFTLSAAEAVCAEDADQALDLIDTLATLVDRSLLQQDEGATSAGDRFLREDALVDPASLQALGSPQATQMWAPHPDGDVANPQAAPPDEPELRFTMFETIREYAQEQLAADDEAEYWHERHVAYYLALMEQAEQDLQETAPMSMVWRTRRSLQPEHGNLRAALTWAITHARGEDALRLAASLCALWVPAGALRVARRWLESAGDLREARRWLEQSLAMDVPMPDTARARALYGLGRVLLFQWEDPNAERQEAIRAFEQSLSLYRRLDDRHGIARCLLDLGGAWYDQEDIPRAEALFDESLALCRALDLPAGAGWSLLGLGRIALTRGEGEHGVPLFEESIAQHRRAGNQLGIAGALDGLGLLRQSQHNYAQALRCFEEAVALRRVVGAQSGLAVALQRLAILLGAGGDLSRSAVLMRESLVLSYRMGNPLDVATGLLTFGGLAVGMRLPEQGARLFGAGEALLESRGLPVPEAYRSLYTRNVAAVRRTLGEEAFAATWAAGQALSQEQAIAEALQIAGRGSGQ